MPYFQNFMMHKYLRTDACDENTNLWLLTMPCASRHAKLFHSFLIFKKTSFSRFEMSCELENRGRASTALPKYFKFLVFDEKWNRLGKKNNEVHDIVTCLYRT